MLGKLVGEFPPAARILVLELHAGRSECVGFGGFRHADVLEAHRSGFRLFGELFALVGRCAVAAAADRERARPIRISEAEMQRGKSAHGQANDVSLVDAEAIEHRANVVAGAGLGVAFDALRDVGGRKAACVIGDAAIALAEVTKLGFPRSAVAGELVHEHDRNAGPDLLIVELHAVVGGDVGHGGGRSLFRALAFETFMLHGSASTENER